MHLTLRQAEQRVLASKSTILRAIKSGRLSAERDGAEGSYRIEPSELFRVFLPKSPDQVRADAADAAPPNSGAMTIIAMRAEVDKLAALLDAERRRGEELREDRDSWREQAERLALMHQAPPPSPATPRETAQDGSGKPNILERIGRALRG